MLAVSSADERVDHRGRREAGLEGGTFGTGRCQAGRVSEGYYVATRGEIEQGECVSAFVPVLIVVGSDENQLRQVVVAEGNCRELGIAVSARLGELDGVALPGRNASARVHGEGSLRAAIGGRGP